MNSAADDEAHHRDDDRVPEARVDVSLRRDDRRREQRQHAAEPAVADVVRQRHRRVTDARREELDEERRDRAVDHRDVDDEDEEDQNRHRPVERGLVEACPDTRSSSAPPCTCPRSSP